MPKKCLENIRTMITFKTKSLTDKDIDTGVYTTMFLSFERAIENEQIKEKVLGYKVTEQGIVIILE